MKSIFGKMIFACLIMYISVTTLMSVKASNVTSIEQIDYNVYTDDDEFDFENYTYELEKYVNSLKDFGN